MVLFLLLSMPLAYLFTLQFLQNQGSFSVSSHRVLRNPLVIGAAFYFVYMVAEFIFAPLFDLEYTWGRAFFVHIVFDIVLPFAVASVLFLSVYAKTLRWEAAAQRFGYQSFLFGFFVLFPVQDLVSYINELGAADAFFRPLSRLAFFVMLPWGLELLRNRKGNFRILLFLIADGLVLAFCAAAAFAFEYTGAPVPALIFEIVVVAHPVLILLVPRIAAGFRSPLVGKQV